MHTDYSGQTLDSRYSVVQLLGRGGMGSVYLGRHIKMGKRVAVKFLHTEFSSSPDLVKRFYREAQAASSVEHSNIINVMDVGVSQNGDPYLIMEYLEGESLASMLDRQGPIGVAAACGVMEPVLLALSAAHERGIIHRDLKPDNIFLVYEKDLPPNLKLIDFGISKFIGSNDKSQLTQTGTLLGTPAYMSPEQVRGDKDIDHRADIYSVGVILYEMLTDKLPFVGQHFNELLVNILTGEPTPPSVAYSNFPKETEPLVMQLLSREPDERPKSALEVLEKIKCLTGYHERESKLTLAASGLTQKSFASGYLGPRSDAVQGSQNVAAEILLDMSSGITRSEWSHTLQNRSFKRSFAIALGGLAVSLVIGLLSLVWLFRPREEENSPTPPMPVVLTRQAALPSNDGDEGDAEKSKKNQIAIEVQALPDNASIYYNNALVPKGMNPFHVKQDTVLIKLEIKAPGYESKALNVLPSTDLVIQGALTPMENNPPEKKPVTSKSKQKKNKFDHAFQ